LGKYNIILEMG